MSEWMPIESAPPYLDILTYAPWDSDKPIGVSRYGRGYETAQEIEGESINKNGRRLIIQERTREVRQWSGDHHEPTHWMPLPEPPKNV